MAVMAFAEIGGRDELEPEIWKLVAWLPSRRRPRPRLRPVPAV
jgi:hypothetical protein